MANSRTGTRTILRAATILGGQGKSAACLLAASFSVAVPQAAHAQAVDRSGTISGRVVAKKSGEEARLVPASDYRNVVIKQKLKAGDVLRTNARGTLALLFADRTQVRLGRNSTMTVNAVRRGGPSSASLRGKAWGRSPRKKSNLRVRTANATAAIRGTEWYLDAGDDFTLLEVYEGSVLLENEFGSVTVEAGQAARAETGQAPVLVSLTGDGPRARLIELGSFADDPAGITALDEARRLLERGDVAGANEAAYDASSIRPYDADVLLVLTETAYADDGGDVAHQQLDAVERAGGSAAPFVRAAIAVQDYDWGRAIDALNTRAGDDHFSGYAANLRDGSLQTQAFGGLGLDAWARYRGDLAYDPEEAVSYSDRNITRRASPFVAGVDTNRVPGESEGHSSVNLYSLSATGSGLPRGNAALGARGGGQTDDSALTNLVLGAVRDPMRIAGTQKDLILSQRSHSSGFVGAAGLEGSAFSGWEVHAAADAVARGGAIPIAVSARVSFERADRDDARYDSLVPALPIDADATSFAGDLQLGFELSTSDRLFAFASHSRDDGKLVFDNAAGGLPRSAAPFTAASVDSSATRAGLFWNHAFGAATHATAGGYYSDVGLRRTEDEPVAIPFSFDQLNESQFGALVLQLAHDAGAATLRGGVDVSWDDGNFELSDLFLGFPTNQSARTVNRRIEPYADVYVDLGALRLHGQLSFWDAVTTPRGSRFDPVPTAFRVEDEGLNFKLGAAFAPVEGQWLRAGVIRENEQGQAFGLMPTDTVGLATLAAPTAGETTNYSARWDAQWSGAFFTSASFDRQDSSGMLFFSPSGLGLVTLGAARIDRFSGAAEFKLGANTGLSAVYIRNDSELRNAGTIDGAGTTVFLNPGDRVPYVPEDEASLTLTLAIPAPVRARFTAGAHYIGERTGVLGTPLDDYVSLDIGAHAEFFDRALLVEAEIVNLLDQQSGDGGYIPSGLTARLGGTLRF